MSRPLFVVSYYAQNKGTTDYFLDFLKQQKAPFYYLKHPLPETNIAYSTLSYFDGKQESTLRTYRRPQSFLLKTAKEAGLTAWTGFRLRLTKKVKTAIGFGSINASALLCSKLLGLRVVFWGVDYSPRRSESELLNKVYLYSETLASRFAANTVQPTASQQQVRIQQHGLRNERAMVIPNGVVRLSKPVSTSQADKLRLIYIGSITPHHGVLAFVQQAYGEFGCKYPITIFGNGSEFAATQTYVKQKQLGDLVTLKGAQTPAQIQQALTTYTERLIGIAPYNNDLNGHVGYGDSLKLKEYVNLGLPFLASNAVTIEPALRQCGWIYHTKQELRQQLTDAASLKLSSKNRETCLQELDWSQLFISHKLLEKWS